MIEEPARVERVEGDYAWLQTQRNSSCGSCNARNGCGVSLIERIATPRTASIRALNRAGAKAGEQVIVGIGEGALVSGSAAIYLLPLAGLFGGAALGEGLAPFNTLLSTEATSIMLGLAGLAGGLLLLKRYALRHRNDPNFVPVVLSTVRQTADVPLQRRPPTPPST